MSLALKEIDYPESDGRPMGETDLHRLWMVRLYNLLTWRYRGQRVYVGSDLLVYFTQGNPRDVVVPDNFVVLDCDSGPRRTFKIWEEGRAPQVAFEITSRSRRREDVVVKPKKYGRIGMEELFLYDPTAEYLVPPLRGFRFEQGRPIEMEPDSTGALTCRVLGLLLRLEDGQLVLRDAVTGAVLLTEAEAERMAKESAEDEVQRLRAELARYRDGRKDAP